MIKYLLLVPILYIIFYIGFKVFKKVYEEIEMWRYKKLDIKKLKIRWTCSDICPIYHRYKWTAWLHGKWLRIRRKL